MAELAGMLASAVLKVVGQQIGSAIGGQITLRKDFSRDLEKMKMTLESVEAMLEDAERRSITEKSVRLWLKRLKDAMYAISDMIDEFEADMQAMKQPSAGKFSFTKIAVVIPCLLISPQITSANRMKTMRKDMEDITSQHNKFNLSEGAYANDLKVIDIRETSSNMDTQIVGRTKEREKILASLSESMTKEMMILSIYGIGGLGKTTLAKMVYNSSQFECYSRVWVYVSQTFDLKKIGNSIISQLSEKEKQYTEMQMINNSLRKLLDDKKILVVLDDLWEDKRPNLSSLKTMLEIGKGSKVVVIVTTRDEGIAKEFSTIQPHKLEPLTDDMCWTIIRQKSDFEYRNDKQKLEQIGKDIAKKCRGVVLAAQSLGHMLQSMKSGEWDSVRNSDIWFVSTSENTSSTPVIASLRLSYSVMPPYLKLCFAYCAIFPKGYKIVKDDLIYQWISLGFIESSNVFSYWQLGEMYTRQLLGLSFLQDSKLPSAAGVFLEDATSFTMHDLVHDLARSVMADEILVAGKQGRTRGSCCHYALLNDCSQPMVSSKLRALRFLDCGEIPDHGSPFSSTKSLRVLDLSECSKPKVPDSIGQLKQLRYLNAQRVQDAIIPNSITGLSKLIYLNLRGSSTILTLPKSIGEIEGLMYLDLSGCSGIEELPESLGRLKKLVHLDLSNCSRVRGVSLLLGSFTELKYLNLSGCCVEELPRLFGDLKNLVHLDLSDCPHVKGVAEALGGFSKLQYLNLSVKLPSLNQHLIGLSEVISNLTELRYLNLSNCMDSIFGTHHDSSSQGLIDSFICLVSNLSNLEHLDLSKNSTIHGIPGDLCKLTKLHTLNLSHCTALMDISKSIRTIDSLKFLYINGCPCLFELPQLGSGAISLPHFVVHPGNGGCTSNLVLLQHTNPDNMWITRLENVKSTEEVQSIELVEKQRLVKLKLEWSRDVERFVDDKFLLEKLVPPRCLMELEILGYNGVSLPAWLMSELPNLKLLVLGGMESLEEWHMSYSGGEEEYVITRLRIYDCPKLRVKPFPPRAKQLEILCSDNVLSSWGECTMSHTGASSSSSPVTTNLLVEHSNVPLHQWRLLHHLHGLTFLSIKSCGDLTGSSEFIRCLGSLETLCLEAKDGEELPEWLGELASLQKLVVQFRGIKELHENIRQLTNLQSLHMYNCINMASLPQWLGELTSLKKLDIWECHGIRSLPEGIQQLTNLQQLYICRCPVLKQWCESAENEMKLAHIRKKDIRRY